jgi:protein-L-isoaspartate(D-aspartate) O-methyltransferase
MLELLQPQKKQKVLDIGSGSGWTTALLAEIVGEEGKVYALEIIPEILEFGKKNVEKLNYKNVEFLLANGSLGLKEKAPFDRILCSAAAPKVPMALKKQLAPQGKLVLPVGDVNQSLILVERSNNLHFTEKRYPGFIFVPLRGKYGF